MDSILGQTLKKYHHFRSYRLKIPLGDKITLSIIVQGEVIPVVIYDINLTGLSFITDCDVINTKLGNSIDLCLSHKRFFKTHSIIVKSQIIRKFSPKAVNVSASPNAEQYFFGVSFDNEHNHTIREFIENYIYSYNPQRLKQYLIESSINQSQDNDFEYLEHLSLFKEIISDYFRPIEENHGDSQILNLWEDIRKNLLDILPFEDMFLWNISGQSGEFYCFSDNSEAPKTNHDILNMVKDSEAPIFFKTSGSYYPLFYTTKDNQNKIFYGVIEYRTRRKIFSHVDELLTNLITQIIAHKLGSFFINPSIPKAEVEYCIPNYLKKILDEELNHDLPLTLIMSQDSYQNDIYQYLKNHRRLPNIPNIQDRQFFVLDLKTPESFNVLIKQSLAQAPAFYILKNLFELDECEQTKLIKCIERLKVKIIFECPYSPLNACLNYHLKKIMSDNIVYISNISKENDNACDLTRLLNHTLTLHEQVQTLKFSLKNFVKSK